MTTISLIGKQYEDCLLFIDKLNIGETNECSQVKKKLGGMYNFSDAKIPEIRLDFCCYGSKSAFIINDFTNGIRTSFVNNQEISVIPNDIIDTINNKSDWLHVCYIDDIEHHDNILKTQIPYSLDFCTLKNRTEYLPIIEKADIVFDSRERKYLYDTFDIGTPIIFHDEKGIEIVKNRKIIFEKSMIPLKNLNVNGAGDLYAYYFIKNYFRLGLEESSYHAMIQTTKKLTERQHEKV